jgi:hypothetical protein
MSYLQKAKDLYAMIGQGQLLEAFEKYYHNDVVMQEAGEAERTGKDVNREHEKQFLGMLKEVHGAGVDGFTSDEENGITMVENWMDMTFQDGNRVRMEQVAVQKWQGDQVIREKFYHK